jgi:hypothetical protein
MDIALEVAKLELERAKLVQKNVILEQKYSKAEKAIERRLALIDVAIAELMVQERIEDRGYPEGE